MKLFVIDTKKNLQVHFARSTEYIGSEGLRLFKFNNQNRKIFLCRIPSNRLISLLSRLTIFNRIIRLNIHAVAPFLHKNNSGLVIFAAKQIYFFDLTLGRLVKLHELKRGRRILREGFCAYQNKIYWGDYWGNPANVEVNINSIDLDSVYSSLYQFSKNAVRHIHTVQFDPYTKFIWVSTGDKDNESQICVINPESGKLMKVVGSGAQKWRTVSFAFRKDKVYWGSDNHLGHNYIWCFERKSEKANKVASVIGPVYYNACLDDFIVFGTTVEKGEGDQDGYGRLYAIDSQNHIEEVWKQEKDAWNPHFFGYGSFEFAKGYLSGNCFWVTAKGFKGGLKSILFKIEKD